MTGAALVVVGKRRLPLRRHDARQSGPAISLSLLRSSSLTTITFFTSLPAMSAPGASTFPVPSYFGQRPLATAASSPTSPTHLQHAVRYSSKTLVLDHMLYLQLNARVRQLRRSSSARLASLSGSQLTDGPSSTSAADEPSEVDRLGYGRRCRSTDGGRSRTAHVQTSSQAPVAHRMPSPIVEEEDESAELEAKAAGYERMLSVLLERVRLSSSGLSTPAPESTASSDEEDDDDDDDYIVSPPEEEAEDEVLPEGVRLRLGLAGLVDVLARPSNDLERLSTDVEQRPEVAAEILAGSVPEPSSAQRQAFARLQPLIPPLSASSRLSRKLRAICLPAAAQARAWFDAGVTGSKHVDSANVSDGSRASRSSTPAPATLSSIGSRQTSASGTFSTSGLGPAPDRWYDLARPSATITSAWSSSHSPSLGGTSTASDSFGRPDDDSGEPGRWVELLERFLLVSADLAIAVGRSTIDEEERRRRARSSARGGVLRPLVARGGHGFTPAFGPRAGAGIGAAAGSWAARLGRTPSTAAFLVPAVVWESDSEESVDEAEAERRAAGDVGLDDSTSDNDDERLAEDSDDPMLEPVDDGRASAPQRLPPRRTRRISNPPSRSRSSSAGSNDSPPRETRASSTTSTAGVDFSVDRSAAARPTRAWFALLAALVRQVILSGFLDAAWRGLSSVEAMLAIGCVSIAATDAAFGDGVSAGRNGSSSSSGRSSSPPEAVVGGIERAGWVLFGCSSAGDTGESKRRREFRRANRLTFREVRLKGLKSQAFMN